MQTRISIHAPTRGATSDNGLKQMGCSISIHAPTRGATLACANTSAKCAISIHAPTRGATYGDNDTWEVCKISIHAPTRGATFMIPTVKIKPLYFNPRSHKGSDFAGVRMSVSLYLFQSTLPQGERRGQRNRY